MATAHRKRSRADGFQLKPWSAQGQAPAQMPDAEGGDGAVELPSPPKLPEPT